MRFSPIAKVLCAVVVCCAFPGPPAEAGQTFRFTIHKDTFPEPSTSTGRVLLEGARYRIEHDPEDDPRPHDIVLSGDAGKPEIGLNLTNKTYYDLDHGPQMSANYLLLPIREKQKVKNVAIEVADEDGGTLEGHATRKWTVAISYDVRIDFFGERITGTVRATHSFWLAEGLELTAPPFLRATIQTTFPEVDEPLAEHLARLKGFPLKQHVAVSAEVDGEAPNTSTTTKLIEEVESRDVPTSAFEVPKGFVYQEPLIGVPGGGKKTLF